MRVALACGCLLCLPCPVAAKSEEAFRLRVTNTLHGAVEVSVDRGKSWALIARVNQAATENTSGATSSLPVVLRASRHGLAFAVGNGRQIRLLPDSPTARRDRAALLVNVSPDSALFQRLLPPEGSTVQQLVHQRPVALISGYVPQDGDMLLFTVTHSETPTDKLAEVAREAAEEYRKAALARLKARGGKPSSGVLTVVAKLAPGDDPAAVTFAFDGAVTAILNRAPYIVRVDTRDWTNGEHLIEVRAVDASGRVLTQTKHLLYVENAPSSG